LKGRLHFSALCGVAHVRVLDYKLAAMKRLKRRRSSWISLFVGLAALSFLAAWTVGYWKQSDENWSRDDNQQLHRVSPEQKTVNKIFGLVFGLAGLSLGVAWLAYEFKGSYALEVEGEKFDFSCELSDDQIVEIGPMHGLNNKALLVSLHYECGWEPPLRSFKIYLHAPPLTYVSYHVQLLNDQAETLLDKTFAHEADGSEGGKIKPRWKKEMLPVSSNSENYTLRVHPIFDRESLERFDKHTSDKRLTIQLQIKLAVCVSPNHRRRAELSQVSLSQARGRSLSTRFVD
jgi:hypothetical protein